MDSGSCWRTPALLIVRTKKAVLKSDELGIERLLEKKMSPKLFWLFLVYLSEK